MSNKNQESKKKIKSIEKFEKTRKSSNFSKKNFENPHNSKFSIEKQKKLEAPRRDTNIPGGALHYSQVAGEYRKELIGIGHCGSMAEPIDYGALDKESTASKIMEKEAKKSSSYLDKLKGCILGFAIGDAMGAPREFLGDLPDVLKFEPSYRKGLAAGQFTDDTQHLEIGLDSLLSNYGEIDLQDHANRLIRWYSSGERKN